MCERITAQEYSYSPSTVESQLKSKTVVRKSIKDRVNNKLHHLLPSLSEPLQRAIELAQEKGASTWLTALPLTEYGFSLHKRAFHDALALRYGWAPIDTPSECFCGSKFSVEHAMSCPKGGFPTIRHNEIRAGTSQPTC